MVYGNKSSNRKPQLMKTGKMIIKLIYLSTRRSGHVTNIKCRKIIIILSQLTGGIQKSRYSSSHVKRFFFTPLFFLCPVLC